MLNKWLVSLIAGTVLLFASVAADAQLFGAAGLQTAVLKSQTTAPYGYYEYLPRDYNHTATDKFGLLIFLHGAGEKGNGESELPKVVHGTSGAPPSYGQWPPGFIGQGSKHYPVIVLSPQCSDVAGAGPAHQGCGWWDGARLVAFARYAIARYNVDLTRIYVSGLSMGGAGTAYLARGMANEIAAIVPICMAEGGNAAADANLRTMPIWATHALDDSTVPYSQSRSFLNAVTQEAADIFTGYDFTDSNGTAPPIVDVDQLALYTISTQTHVWLKQTSALNFDHDVRQRYTVYRDGNHNIWGRTYNDSNIMRWLFAQRLGAMPATCNLDLNSDGVYNIADARTTVAWALGVRGAPLQQISGFVGMTGEQIHGKLQAQKNSLMLDLDDDGLVRPMTDGLMLLRVSLGLSGTAVTNGAVNAAGTRKTWAAIRTYLNANCNLALP